MPHSLFRLALSLPAVVLLAGVAVPPTSVAAVPEARKAPAVFPIEMPIRFEENRGQVDGRVRYVSRTAGHTLFLTRHEAVLALGENQKGDRPVLRLSFQGGRPAETVDGLDRLPGFSHYLRGSDASKWIRDVPRFGRVQLGQVYPGVDIVFYDNQRTLEYDIVLEAGVEASLVRARLEGASALEVDARGDLVIHTAAGTVTQPRPFAYQAIAGRMQPVDACYEVTGRDTFRFHLAALDPGSPTVIDPVVVYSSYLGGNHQDLGVAASTGAGKKVYVTGYTRSTDFPTTGLGARGLEDMFLSQFDFTNPAVPVETSLYVGGAGNDEGLAIAAEGDRAFVVGQTSGSFPTVTPQAAYGGGAWDAFLFGYDFNLTTTIAATYLGGTLADAAYSVAVRGPRVWVTGATNSADFPVLSSMHAYLGATDAFVTEYDTSGGLGAVSILLSTYLGTASTDIGSAIDIDANGFAYVAGYSEGTSAPQLTGHGSGGVGAARTRGSRHDLAPTVPLTDALSRDWAVGEGDVTATAKSGGAVFEALLADPLSPLGEAATENGKVTGGASMVPCTPTGDAFITVLNTVNSPPTVALRRLFGGSCIDHATAVRVSPTATYIQIVGYTASSDFPAPGGQAFGGMTDGFVRRMDLGGKTLYSSFLGGTDVDYLYALDLDAAGHAYVAGYTNSPDFPHTANAVQSMNAGSTDVIAGVYDSAGGKFFATYHGGMLADFGRGIAFAREAGIAYLIGYTLSADYPTTPGALQPTKGAVRDAVLTSFGAITPPNPHCLLDLDESPALYDNGNPQTTGVFRDWSRNLAISRGPDVGGTGHQAINFKNFAAIAAIDAVTFHDTTPANGLPETHRGTSFLEADVLVHDAAPGTPNMSRFIGLVALFNEGPGQVGIALLRKDQVGVNDTLNIRIIDQTGDVGSKPNLVQRTFTSGANDDEWYRLSMRIEVDVPADQFTITAKLFTHLDPADPHSPLGPQVDSVGPGNGTVVYTASLSDPKGDGTQPPLDPSGRGQVGIVFDRVNGTTGQASVANLCFDVCTAGSLDCNGMSVDGCEVDSMSDPANCGGCGLVCGGGTPFCASGVCTGAVTYSQNFTSGQSSPLQCQAWNTFRGQLNGTFTQITMKGSSDTVGFTCTGAFADTLCQGLRTGMVVPPTACDGHTWAVDLDCGIVGSVELTAAGVPCDCTTPGYSVRPCIANDNWGGVNTPTCAAPTQTMTVICQ